MTKIIFIGLLAFILSGCDYMRELDIFTTPTPVEIIHPSLPEQAQLRSIEITNLNKEIIEEMLNDPTFNENDFVFITLTPKGYEALSLNLQELKRVIEHQKAIIKYYRKITTELEEIKE